MIDDGLIPVDFPEGTDSRLQVRNFCLLKKNFFSNF